MKAEKVLSEILKINEKIRNCDEFIKKSIGSRIRIVRDEEKEFKKVADHSLSILITDQRHYVQDLRLGRDILLRQLTDLIKGESKT